MQTTACHLIKKQALAQHFPVNFIDFLRPPVLRAQSVAAFVCIQLKDQQKWLCYGCQSNNALCYTGVKLGQLLTVRTETIISFQVIFSNKLWGSNLLQNKSTSEGKSVCLKYIRVVWVRRPSMIYWDNAKALEAVAKWLKK